MDLKERAIFHSSPLSRLSVFSVIVDITLRTWLILTQFGRNNRVEVWERGWRSGWRLGRGIVERHGCSDWSRMDNGDKDQVTMGALGSVVVHP